MELPLRPLVLRFGCHLWTREQTIQIARSYLPLDTPFSQKEIQTASEYATQERCHGPALRRALVKHGLVAVSRYTGCDARRKFVYRLQLEGPVGFIREISKRVSVEERRESVVLTVGGDLPNADRIEVLYTDLPDILRGLSETAGRKLSGESMVEDVTAETETEEIRALLAAMRDSITATRRNLRDVADLFESLTAISVKPSL